MVTEKQPKSEEQGVTIESPSDHFKLSVNVLTFGRDIKRAGCCDGCCACEETDCKENVIAGYAEIRFGYIPLKRVSEEATGALTLCAECIKEWRTVAASVLGKKAKSN